MAWQFEGVVFEPQTDWSWVRTHAMLPTPLLLDDRIRLYYCSRGHDGRSRTSYVDLSREDPRQRLHLQDTPVLDIGALGCFDDAGALPGSVLRVDGQVYLYYVGYNIRGTVPYSNAIGLAISRDDGRSFRRAFPGPVVDRNRREPYFCVSPGVLHEEGRWLMWYASCTDWIEVNGKPESLYHIKFAESADGIDWRRDNHSCIVPRHPHEANVRPTVVRRKGKYHMWYCYRGSLDFRDGADSYRLGYAQSKDGRSWTRMDDDPAAQPPRGDFDATMQGYPAVLDTGRDLYLFYNGTGFGQTGIGLARWQD